MSGGSPVEELVGLLVAKTKGPVQKPALDVILGLTGVFFLGGDVLGCLSCL
jgi:hypothetical protein